MSTSLFKIYTFGCRVNQAESIKIEESLQKEGFKPTTSGKQPDIVIINSCVVTQKAEKEVRQLIRRVKRENPKSFIIVCGCAVNLWKKVGFPRLPVGLWIENEKKPKVCKIINKIINKIKIIRHYYPLPTSILNSIELKSLNHYQQSRRPGSGQSEVPPPMVVRQRRNSSDGGTKWMPSSGVEKKYQKSGRLIIKIQDGCNQFCTFCIVPFLRKKIKSKKIERIVKEVKEAEKRGIKEVVLSGINLGLFGQDTNENLVELLKKLLKETKTVRFRFGSIYPEVIDEKFIETYKKGWQKDNGRLCRFFHLPLQSGSEKILKLMGRKYTLTKFASIIKNLYQETPQSLIATDIIVGFPGEGEKEFKKTYDFLTSLPIAKFHLFRFSKRSQTVAAKMEEKWGRVDEKIKKKRLKILKELEREKYERFLKSLIAKTLPVLFLKKENSRLIGIADNSVAVRVISKENFRGKIRKVLITKIDYPYLIGNIIK